MASIRRDDITAQGTVSALYSFVKKHTNKRTDASTLDSAVKDNSTYRRNT